MRNGDYQFEGSADDPSGPASYPRLTKADLPSSLQSTWLCCIRPVLIHGGVLIKETKRVDSSDRRQRKNGAMDSGQNRAFDHRNNHIEVYGSAISLEVWMCMQMQELMCLHCYDAIIEKTKASCLTILPQWKMGHIHFSSQFLYSYKFQSLALKKKKKRDNMPQ